MRERPSTVLVLVHSPLVGASTWQPVARALREREYVTVVPSVTGVFEAEDGKGGRPYYPRLASHVADQIQAQAGDGPVLLVAHSGAGALLPAVADAIEAQGVTTAGMVFVDALLPHPGRSWFDTVPAEMREQLSGLVRGGLLPPWDEWFPPGAIEELLPDPAMRAALRAGLPRLPLGYFVEAAPEFPDGLDPSRCGYLQLSDGYAHEARQAERDGWRVVRRDTHHLALLTEPGAIADAIADAIEELADPAG